MHWHALGVTEFMPSFCRLSVEEYTELKRVLEAKDASFKRYVSASIMCAVTLY
jgi:hypothetical protein